MEESKGKLWVQYALLLLACCCFIGQRIVSAEKEEYSAGGVLSLERLFPANHTTVHELEARDRARQARFLRSSTSNTGVTNFPLIGSFDPNLIGMYYTKIKLGSPPREYSMIIDTGSDISWISCSSCTDCPRTSGLGVELNFYDTGSSSTASVIDCSAPNCECNKKNQCMYTLSYEDKSATTGYFVLDLLHLDTNLRTLQNANSSTPIIFGCSTSRSGHLAMTYTAVDGVLGFDRRSLSIISQLSSRRISPKVFSHCLKGEDGSGGILVLGEIVNPSMVYSPLVPSKGHYNVYLQSITVNGKSMSIDPAVFAASGDRGTIVDSGTTLVYLVAEAYESVITAISAVVSPSAKSTILETYPCYLLSSSLSNNIAEVFPTISLNFAGGASMHLRPADYLKKMSLFEGASTWCIVFVRESPSLSIIGDIALKDRIVVYDLARQRVGWADYNCSLPMNVSISSGTNDVAHPGALYHIIELVLIFYLFWSQ